MVNAYEKGMFKREKTACAHNAKWEYKQQIT